MADTSKAQKLASGKKRFKELKDQRKQNAASQKTPENGTPANSMASSTHSVEEPPPTATLPNYFSASVPEPAAFFDNLTSTQPSYSYEPNGAFTNTPANYFDGQDRGENFFDQPQNEPTPDSLTLDYPEVQHNLFNHTTHAAAVSDKDAQELVSYMQQTPSEVTDTFKEETLNKPDIQGHSNIESLRQLSDQMAELIDSNSEYAVSTSITDLEKRNLELAALYEQEKIKTEQLSSSLRDVQNKNKDLEEQLKQKDLSTDILATQQFSRLKDELQSQIQINGMLIAEKTELATSLTQLELNHKQKTVECEELQARLKTSRSSVADLQREIHNLKAERSKIDSLGKEQLDQYEKLGIEYKKLKEYNEEIHQDLQEAREKLKQTGEENVNLMHQVQEVNSKLSLANIKIQQLTTGESHQVEAQIEQLTGEKFALEKQVSSLNQMLKTLQKERDESSQQYQQYAEQLNGQVYSLSNTIEQLNKEKENLIIQDQNRVKHLGELERQLQNLQNEHVDFASQKSGSDTNLKNDYEATKELLVQVQIDKTNLEESYTKVANEKEMLLKELAAKNESLSQLESMVEQLRGNQPDSVKLLATMESDKVAAARAVAQNKELKQQMEGMNEVFMKLNNDKVELTEKLAVEKKSNKELFDKLQKTEITLQTLADAIEIKDRELSSLRDSSETLSKQMLHQEQLNDRLRHYEAKDHCSHALETELQDAKSVIARLTNELNELKNGQTVNSNGLSHEDEHLKDKLAQLQLRNEELERKVHEGGKIDVIDSISNKDKNDNDELDKEVAMKYLEDKFTRTMQDIAELQDEKQRLEHLVLQLQSETETIGEYVALYQHQRMVLKQRALEKDQQLKQLACDREQMKEKLQKLNRLIHKITNKESLNVNNINLQEGQTEKDLQVDNEEKHHNVVVKEGETAKEIIELLGEIETSNLVQPTNEDFHHCPWCSGKLITV